MRFVNANVYAGGRFVPGILDFDRKIRYAGRDPEEAPLPGTDVLDAEGGYLIPGLIDIHTHGAVLSDASDGDPEGLLRMSLYYAGEGVTSWCPTTMTAGEEVLSRAVRTVRDFRRPASGAKIAGINMEGPFLSSGKSGAQNRASLRDPDAGFLERLNDLSGGLVRLVSVAPELPGAFEFIRRVSSEVRVALAHTGADYDTCMEAFRCGASHVTHLFNCMPGIHHRMPGTVPAALDSGATAELITDGFHIHPSVIRLAGKLFGEKLCLISDSLRCAGEPDGDYDLAGLRVTVSGGRAVLTGTDTLAGSSVHLMEGLRRSVRFGIPLEKAVFAATAVPAAVIGRDREIGSLEEGKAADFVLLDKELNVKAVYIDGFRTK